MKGICLVVLAMLVVSATSLSRSRFRSRRTAVSRDSGSDFRDGLYKDEWMPEQVEDESWSDLVMDPACEMECMNHCSSNCRERCCF